MTRLALCFSGDPRTYKTCYESLKNNLLDKFDCDVFISSYHTDAATDDDLVKLYQPKKIIFNDKDTVLKHVSTYSENLDRVKVNRVPVLDKKCKNTDHTYNIEDFFFNYTEYETKFEHNRLTTNALGQFYGIYDVSKLLADYMSNNSVVYDFILRLRLDGTFKKEFIIPNGFGEGEILINEFQHYSDSIKLHDHFFMCKPQTYFKIASLYTNLKTIIDIINTSRCWLPTSGYQETLFLIHVIFHRVKIMQSPVWFAVCRPV